jgi:hypothetical protein
MFARDAALRKRAFNGPLRRRIMDTERLQMWNQAAIYRRRRRTFAVAVALVLLLVIIVIVSPGGGGLGPGKRVAKRGITLPLSAAPLSYHAAPALLAPVLASAAAPIPGKTAFTLLGGLDTGDNATATVATIDSTGTHPVGYLPASLFAAAAATVGDEEYLFGGAEGTATTPVPQPLIYSYTVLGSGAVDQAGELPTGNYGLSAAAIGHTIYLVGGDSGSVTLKTILAWKPHGGAPVSAGTLPIALRYAAVAAVGEQIVIAGGLTASGAPSNAIFVFDAATRKVRELPAKLPDAIYAASGATLGQLAYVLGGAELTGVAPNTSVAPVSTIYSIDPATGKLANAGSLQYPLAEASATVVGSTIYIAGGLSGGNAVAYVGTLTSAQTASKTTSKTKSNH